MFIVCPSTVWNSAALETRSVPKRMIGRIAILPRAGVSGHTIARLIFEVQVLRFFIALAPFIIAMLIWPHLALPISQAPIPMLFLIYFVETRVLNMPKEKRAALIDEDDMQRTLDALDFNARRLLTRIGARQDLTEGMLHLVIEQSEMARVPPLTLVSVQIDGAETRVLDLDATDRALIDEMLFDESLTPAQVHLVTLRQNQNLRSVAIDLRDISAHARMAAKVASTPQMAGVAP